MSLNFVKIKRCTFCNTDLPISTPASFLVCGSLACRQQRVRLEREQQESQRNKRELLLAQQLEQLKVSTAKDISRDERDLQLRRVPYQRNAPEILSDESREVFVGHLQSLLDSLDKTDLDRKYRAPHPKTNPFPDPNLIASACSACRGQCCVQGFRTGAFIERETLLQSFEHFPKLSHAEVKQLYIDCIPKDSVKNSCIYHTGAGCALQPKLRAKICNDFYCQDLREFTVRPESENILFVAIEEQEIRSTLIVSVFGS